ncbi:ALP1-like protein [Tanacetum coccineum]
MDSDPFFTFSDDEEDEVKSIDLQCFKEAVMVLQASTSTIPKTPINQKMIHKDRYGAHDRLVPAYLSENSIDCTGTLDILSLMKCIFAIRQSAYDTFPDALDEYLQIGENTFRDSIYAFYKAIIGIYGDEFLRRPAYIDVKKLYAFHIEKHGFPGMLENVDCTIGRELIAEMHYRAQYCRGDHGPHPFILLGAIASQDLCI